MKELKGPLHIHADKLWLRNEQPQASQGGIDRDIVAFLLGALFMFVLVMLRLM